MSTTTPNIGLTKPTPGDPTDRNLWGGLVNGNSDTLDAMFKGDGTGTSHGSNIGTGKTLSIAGTLAMVTGGIINVLAGALNVFASLFSIKDPTDSTKVAKFDASAISTGTTRTYTLPNTSTTLVGTSGAQTLTNKTLTSPIVGTAGPGDNSTVAASTAYVDRVVSQTGQVSTASVTTGTTQIPLDNTIPQNTEGDQVMTASITPKSATSFLYITVVLNFGFSVSPAAVTVALFQDSTANALGAGASFIGNVGVPQQLVLQFIMISGTTSSTTFKVRAGGNTAGTITFNGAAGAGLFGGALLSSITIREVI